MMNDSLISGVPNIIFLILGVLIVVLIIVLVIMKKNSNESKVSDVSILDVNNSGVSEVNKEFSYGYEKEQTTVMDPINPNEIPSPEVVSNPSVINTEIPAQNSYNNEQLSTSVPVSNPIESIEQVTPEPVNISPSSSQEVLTQENVEPVNDHSESMIEVIPESNFNQVQEEHIQNVEQENVIPVEPIMDTEPQAVVQESQPIQNSDMDGMSDIFSHDNVVNDSDSINQ